MTRPIMCVYTSEMQIFRHKMQQKHTKHKLSTHNCACGLHILVHNKYILYKPRFNRLFIAVRVAKLYTHAVHSAPPAQKGAVQIWPVQKKESYDF